MSRDFRIKSNVNVGIDSRLRTHAYYVRYTIWHVISTYDSKYKIEFCSIESPECFQLEYYSKHAYSVYLLRVVWILTLDAEGDRPWPSHSQIVITLTRVPTGMAASHVPYDQSASAQKNDFDFRVDTDASVATAILQDWMTLQYIIRDAINNIEIRFVIRQWLLVVLTLWYHSMRLRCFPLLPLPSNTLHSKYTSSPVLILLGSNVCPKLNLTIGGSVKLMFIVIIYIYF